MVGTVKKRAGCCRLPWPAVVCLALWMEHQRDGLLFVNADMHSPSPIPSVEDPTDPKCLPLEISARALCLMTTSLHATMECEDLDPEPTVICCGFGILDSIAPVCFDSNSLETIMNADGVLVCNKWLALEELASDAAEAPDAASGGEAGGWFSDEEATWQDYSDARLAEMESRLEKKESDREATRQKSVMDLANDTPDLTSEEMDALVFSFGEPAERSNKSDKPVLKKKKKKSIRDAIPSLTTEHQQQKQHRAAGLLHRAKDWAEILLHPGMEEDDTLGEHDRKAVLAQMFIEFKRMFIDPYKT